jgi:hypothetical protein
MSEPTVPAGVTADTTPEPKAKTRKPGAPLQRTLIALARAPKNAKNADEERQYLLIGYATAAEEALAEARRRLNDLQRIIRDTARRDWKKNLEQCAAGLWDIAERAARAAECETDPDEARDARSEARDARAEAEKLTAIIQHFSKASERVMAHSEEYQTALQEAQALAGDLRQEGEAEAADELESDLERIVAWADGRVS